MDEDDNGKIRLERVNPPGNSSYYKLIIIKQQVSSMLSEVIFSLAK